MEIPPGGQELLRGATTHVNGLFGEVPPERGAVGTLKRYLFMTGIRKGYFSCQEWYSIRVSGVRDWTLRRSSPF